jgi:2-hydroxychromene-2-carboxylate isomerase
MGDLVVLGERLQERSALSLGDARPSFYFDLACPLSYLAAERVERMLGAVEWIPASGGTFRASSLVGAAEERAGSLRLPLVWPEGFPAPVPGAMRAATYACEGGAGARFGLAAFRLAFCGGFELDRPEVLDELAGASGIPRAGCVDAACDESRDERLSVVVRGLRRAGVTRLPAFRIGDRFFAGEPSLVGAAALLRSGQPVAHPA